MPAHYLNRHTACVVRRLRKAGEHGAARIAAFNGRRGGIVSRPATLEFSSVLAGRIFYGLRRAGFTAKVAHTPAERSARGYTVARILAHANGSRPLPVARA